MDTASGVTTFAVAAATPHSPIATPTVPIAVIGTDAVLAAAPATPVQLAHACLRAGFANVIPASWGDELIAAAVLRRLPQFGNGPVIQCSCPIVAHRLLTAGGDLRPVLLPLVPPPVAVARYLRSLARPARTRITYIGACPGAVDESIDIRMSADALIAMLAERDIVIGEQPEVFESIIPPDRRRFRSQPGGVPTAEALWTEFGARTLVELDGEDFVTEVAQHLLTGKNILIDPSTRLGCACSGATSGVRNPRAQVVAHEPPRSTSPVVEERTPIDLDLAVPAVTRTPVDVAAVSAATASTRPITPPNGTETVVPPRTPPPRSNGPSAPAAPATEVRLPRLSTPVVPRSVLSAFPQSRDPEGKALPRAYFARRRSSPRGLSVVLPPDELASIEGHDDESSRHSPVAATAVAEPSHPATIDPPATTDAAHLSPSPAPTPPATPRPVEAEPEAASVVLESPLAADPAPIIEDAAPVAAKAPVVAESPLRTPDHPSAIAAAPAEAAIPTAQVQMVSDPVFAERQSGLDDVPRSRETPAASIEPARRPIGQRTPPRSVRPVPTPTPAPQAPAPTASFSRGQIVLIFIAVTAIAICASTVVGVIVSRSVTAASLSTPTSR